MSKETDAQYARSVDNVAYARSRCPESKKLCPKCGSEMAFMTVSFSTEKKEVGGHFWLCQLISGGCSHEEKVGGEKDVH